MIVLNARTSYRGVCSNPISYSWDFWTVRSTPTQSGLAGSCQSTFIHFTDALMRVLLWQRVCWPTLQMLVCLGPGWHRDIHKEGAFWWLKKGSIDQSCQVVSPQNVPPQHHHNHPHHIWCIQKLSHDLSLCRCMMVWPANKKKKCSWYATTGFEKFLDRVQGRREETVAQRLHADLLFLVVSQGTGSSPGLFSLVSLG